MSICLFLDRYTLNTNIATILHKRFGKLPSTNGLDGRRNSAVSAVEVLIANLRFSCLLVRMVDVLVLDCTLLGVD